MRVQVNMGEALEYWTDGKLKACFHRVRSVAGQAAACSSDDFKAASWAPAGCQGSCCGLPGAAGQPA